MSKLLHLPEEAALVLRAHELSLVEDWSVWIDSFALNLNNHSRTRQGFIQTVQYYNAQASNFKMKTPSLTVCVLVTAVGAYDYMWLEIPGREEQKIQILSPISKDLP